MSADALHERFIHALGADVSPAGSKSLTVRCSDREAALRAVEICRDTRSPWKPGASMEEGRVALQLVPADPLLDLWREDLVARVSAGATLAALDARLVPLGLCLPNETPAPGVTTVGGSFAEAESGWGLRASGALRERALGVLAVDGNARLVKGGARVVKNVAGFDLTRLHYGARGAFGMALDFLLRLEARPEVVRTRVRRCALVDVEAALRAARRPSAELEGHVQLWLDPAASRSVGGPDEGALVMVLEGRGDVAEAWASSFGDGELDADSVRDFGYTGGSAPWRLSMSSRRLLECWPRWTERWKDAGIVTRLAVDLAGGNHRLVVDRASDAAREDLARQLRAEGVKLRIPGTRHTEATRPGAVARRLKSAFDPHGLLPAVPS